MKTKVFAVVVLASCLIHCSVATGTPIISNGGIADSPFTLTFNEIPLTMGDVVTDQYSSFGIIFDITTLPFFTESDIRYNVQGGGGGGGFAGIIGNYIGSSGGNPVSMIFSAPQDQVVFGLASNPRSITFTALLNGIEVESFTIATTGGSFPSVDGQPAGYYGFTGIIFDQINIFSHLTNPVDNRILLDNVAFDGPTPAAVPEPSTMLLIASGLIGLVGLRRRFGE
jgi:hypothetical protein